MNAHKWFFVLTNNLPLIFHKLHSRDAVLITYKSNNWALSGLWHGRKFVGVVVVLAVPHWSDFGTPARIKIPALKPGTVINFIRWGGDLI